jgi:hypothetical protein
MAPDEKRHETDAQNRAGRPNHKAVRREPSGCDELIWFISRAICVVLLAALCFGCYCWWNLFSISKQVPHAKEKADHFLELIRSDQLREAYQLMSSDYHSRNSLIQFKDYVSGIDALSNPTPYSTIAPDPYQAWVLSDSKRTFVVYVHFQLPNDRVFFTIVVVEEAHTLKVDRISVNR